MLVTLFLTLLTITLLLGEINMCKTGILGTYTHKIDILNILPSLLFLLYVKTTKGALIKRDEGSILLFTEKCSAKLHNSSLNLISGNTFVLYLLFPDLILYVIIT